MSATAAVAPFQRRLRMVDLVWALASGAVGIGAGAVLGGLVSASPDQRVPMAVLTGAVVAVGAIWRAFGRWTPDATARVIEARVEGLANLVVSAVELDRAPARATPRMRDAVVTEAARRLAGVSVDAVGPLGRPLALATLLTVAAGFALWSVARPALAPEVVSTPIGTVPAIQQLRVVVTPPAYLQQAARTVSDVNELRVAEGSQLRIELDATWAAAWLDAPGGARTPLVRDRAGPFQLAWTPTVSQSVVVGAGNAAGEAGQSRLLSVIVVPDAAPSVRIAEPGRDLGFPTTAQTVPIAIHATDAEGLRALELRYVRLSGSGETFDFTEGRVPVTIERVTETEWRGQVRWPLSSTGMGDGDSLVYRAAVRDSHPTRDWVLSDSFTIDVGKRLEFTGAGFAIPDEERRYAISQQMVIVKTERLLADRPTLTDELWTAETKFLAIEQRRVRAEVVFLSGGEVQDEVAEAEHSHELQEGRLENAGRAEMLRALNEMSRAEARLNDGDGRGALVFERAALAALQRAFDRRRYFLRTLSERSRIDPTRRLSGDLSEASSFARPVPDDPADPLAVERGLMRELSAIAQSGHPPPAGVVPTLASLPGADAALRSAAAALADAMTVESRRAAVTAAMRLLTARARARLGPAARVPPGTSGELNGWWADEWRARRPR